MTIPGGAALAAMNADDFAAVVKDSIHGGTPAVVWDALTDPAVIDRTRICLSAIRNDVQNQLAVANSATEEARAEAIADGEEGRDAFRAAKNEQAEWRRRAMRFLRAVDQRKALVRSRSVHSPRPLQSPPGTKTARMHNFAALERLAQAVGEHRSRVLSGEGSEDDDEALWACLNTITAIAGDDEMPLEKWLRHLEEEREDDE